MRRLLLLAGLPALLMAPLAGCPRPASPDTERPPEPQAAQIASRDAAPAPIERAQAIQPATQAAVEGTNAAGGAQPE